LESLKLQAHNVAKKQQKNIHKKQRRILAEVRKIISVANYVKKLERKVKRLEKMICSPNIPEFQQYSEHDVAVALLFFAELKRARLKHPVWPKEDVFHAVSIIGEEHGETVRATNRHMEDGKLYSDIEKEVIQTGSSCIRFLTQV